ncbi:MAG: TetR family transcriptional regulator [Candidatus Sphingomonas phytovorans]|nr:TetR family transcriptional regulator [Sphingomonas sp.]WEK02251.1 MAG: TetR family transcriptional regulator [Sphingomonas sp.]
MGKSDITKQRLLEAATVEFATHGIAGARVDRIATTAGCNKQAIYAYFGSKDGLFDAVYEQMVIDTVESVPIDPLDLPGYAASLFDHYRDHPEVQKLSAWHQFERLQFGPDTRIAASATKQKIDRIKEAQSVGAITDLLPAEYLLGLILRMATIGVYGSLESKASSTTSRKMRQALIDGVRRLVTP